MVKPRKRKDESQEAYLKRACLLYKEHGYYISEIAKRLEISVTKVCNYTNSKFNLTTEEEREEMIKLRSLGLSYSEIAREVGRSRSCVKNRIDSPVKITCTPKQELTDKEIKKIETMVHDGAYVKTIAEELGIPENTIKYRMRHSRSMNRKRDKVSEAESKRFMRLYKRGNSYTNIAKKCNRSLSTVSRHIRAKLNK